MRRRRGISQRERLCSGPGKLTQALGITLEHNGTDLGRGPVLISAPRSGWEELPVAITRRIGITKASELPWRFCVTGSRFTSRRAAG
jgi:DNA-3-methyladenine glycosylase